MFTRLTVGDMIAIVVAAQPGTAVYHATTGGYGVAEHLLATSLELQGGLISLPQRIARDGVTDLRPAKMPDIRDPKTKKLMWDSMTIPEFEALRKARLKELR
jgi:hypothetical protein